jgi:hypothetical protein
MAIADNLRPILKPHQLGYATESGFEVITHAARKVLSPSARQAMENSLLGIFLKFDYANAFKTVRRSRILAAALEHSPALYSYIKQAYGAPSWLFFGVDIIESGEGPQLEGSPCPCPFLPGHQSPRPATKIRLQRLVFR